MDEYKRNLSINKTALVEQYKAIIKLHNEIFSLKEHDEPVRIRCDEMEQAFRLPFIRNQLRKVQPMFEHYDQETDDIGDWYNYLTGDKAKYGGSTKNEEAISIFTDIMHDMAKSIAEIYGIQFIMNNDLGIQSNNVPTYNVDPQENTVDLNAQMNDSTSDETDIEHIVNLSKQEKLKNEMKEDVSSKLTDWAREERDQLELTRNNMERINDIKLMNVAKFRRDKDTVAFVKEMFPQLKAIKIEDFHNSSLDIEQVEKSAKRGQAKRNALYALRQKKQYQAIFNKFLELAKVVEVSTENEIDENVRAAFEPENFQKMTDKKKVTIVSDNVLVKSTFKVKKSDLDDNAQEEIFPNRVPATKGKGNGANSSDDDDDDICGVSNADIDKSIEQMMPSLLQSLDINTKKLIVKNQLLTKQLLTQMTYNNMMGFEDRYGAKTYEVCKINDKENFEITVTFDEHGNPQYQPKIELLTYGSVDAIQWRATKVVTELPKFHNQRRILKNAHICVDEQTDSFYTRKLMDRNNEGWAEAMTIKEINSNIKLSPEEVINRSFMYNDFTIDIEKFESSQSQLSLDFDSYLCDIITTRTVSYVFSTDLISILNRYQNVQVQVDYTGYFKVIKNKRSLSYNTCDGKLEDKYLNVSNDGKLLYHENGEIEFLLRNAYNASTFAVTGTMSIENTKILLDSVLGFFLDELPSTISNNRYVITFKSYSVHVAKDNPNQEGYNLRDEITMRTHKRMTRSAILRYVTLLPWFNICLNLIRGESGKNFKELLRLLAIYLMLLYSKDTTTLRDNPPRRVVGEMIMDRDGIPLTTKELDDYRTLRKEELNYHWMTPRQETTIDLSNYFEERYVYDEDSVRHAINNTGSIVDSRFTSFIILFLSMLCSKK